MKITSSNIDLSAQSSGVQAYSKTESFSAGGSGGGIALGRQKGNSVFRNDSVDISETGKSLSSASAQATGRKRSGIEISDKDKLRLNLIEQMFKNLTGGKKMRFFSPSDFASALGNNGLTSLASILGATPSENAVNGLDITYTSREEYYESQDMSFSASGTATTADGMSISLDVSLSMSREFYTSNTQTLNFGSSNLHDPLAVNFDGMGASLTDTKFQFDIDCDGQADSISFLGQGSGFLALDLNEDGKVNDGGELFGTQSGDGFADLAAYDEDNNGWIDENDSIYENLRIWTKDESGKDRLLAVGQVGVGAIYLGSVESQFDLKGADNATNGRVASSGVYLNENGTAGIIQHVDIAL